MGFKSVLINEDGFHNSKGIFAKAEETPVCNTTLTEMLAGTFFPKQIQSATMVSHYSQVRAGHMGPHWPTWVHIGPTWVNKRRNFSHG